MISIIICVRKSLVKSELEFNIRSTIGMEHEVIFIENKTNQYSLTQAYNIGVKKSKYEFLCFMHDDVLYNSINWGEKIVSHLSKANIGAIAIAGSPFQSFFPGSWFSSKILNMYLLQGDRNRDRLSYLNEVNNVSKSNEVVSFDGCWFCTRKEIFDQIQFDEVNFAGFHFYDADLALQIYKTGKKLITIDDVLISHFSEGSTNLDYIKHSLLFQQKWATELPVSACKIPSQKAIKAEFIALEEFIWICSKNNILNKKMWRKIMLFVLKKHYLDLKTPYYIFKSLKNILL